MIVSSVTKNKTKMKVLFENKESLLIDYDLVAKYSLYRGKEISSSLFNSLKEEEKLLELYKYSVTYLSKYSKSTYCFKLYLLNKSYKLDAVDKVLVKLENEKYLDDTRYTTNKIYSLVNKGYGTFYIEKKLENLGISESIYANFDRSSLKELYLEKFNKIALRQLDNYSKYSISKKKTKINNFLVRRGYEFSLINNFISENVM